MIDNPAVTFENVSFAYNGENVLEQVNLSLPSREFVWIVGPNGGGKTTLLKLMMGILKPSQGKVKVFGEVPSNVRQLIGYMPQESQLDLKFPFRVIDVVLMGRLGNSGGKLKYSNYDYEVVEKALNEVGLSGKEKLHFSQLSGGQMRRLLIARALACEPDLLLLDEPTANLDLLVVRELYELLAKLSQHLSVIMVSHDPAFVSESVQKVVCVRKKVHVHPTTELDNEMLSELYGGQVRIVRHGLSSNGESEG